MGRKVVTGYELKLAPFESPEEVRGRLKFLGKLFTDAQQDAALLLSGLYSAVCPDLLRMAREWQPVPQDQRVGKWVNYKPTERAPPGTTPTRGSSRSHTFIPTPCAMLGKTTRMGVSSPLSWWSTPVWSTGMRTRAARLCCAYW